MHSFDSAVSRIVSQRLKALGFARRGLLWNRRDGRKVQVIQFQQDKYNSSLNASFTVNLGVGRASSSEWLSPRDCRSGSCRLGTLRPGGGDRWWPHDPTDQEETDAAMKSALADIEKYGFLLLSWSWKPAASRGFEGVRRLAERFITSTNVFARASAPPFPEPWNGLRSVVEGAIRRARREVAGTGPELVGYAVGGAFETIPSELQITYFFGTDDALAQGATSGLQQRLVQLTEALLMLRGYPNAALGSVSIKFSSGSGPSLPST
jgi:hypothetical protein